MYGSAQTKSTTIQDMHMCINTYIYICIYSLHDAFAKGGSAQDMNRGSRIIELDQEVTLRDPEEGVDLVDELITLRLLDQATMQRPDRERVYHEDLVLYSDHLHCQRHA